MRLPFSKRPERANPEISMNEYLSYFTFNGVNYSLNQTIQGDEIQIAQDYAALAMQGFGCDSVVFSCEMVRVNHFTEATFKYRRVRNGRPGDLFGTADLGKLEKPWPGATTGDLLALMLLHADIGGNAFVCDETWGLCCLRPDWVTIVAGSPREGASVWDPDAKVLGYVYQPGGPGSGKKPISYLPEQVAHFAPIPDPMARFRGMSWMRPVIQDIIGDRQATEHKTKFYENGATPNMVISLDISDPEKFKAFVDLFREQHEGAANAYKTLFLGAGADPKVVGADFRQQDFKQTVGVSETRIAAAAGTPPVLVGLSEGLQGSSLNQGNYNSARRRFADGTMRPLWRNVCGSLASITKVPSDAQLWYDDRDIAFLREDAAENATVKKDEASTIQILVNSGYVPESVVAAVSAGDWSLLEHTGMLSVQLQEPGAEQPAPSANGKPDAAPVLG